MDKYWEILTLFWRENHTREYVGKIKINVQKFPRTKCQWFINKFISNILMFSYLFPLSICLFAFFVNFFSEYSFANILVILAAKWQICVSYSFYVLDAVFDLKMNKFLINKLTIIHLYHPLISSIKRDHPSRGPSGNYNFIQITYHYCKYN